MKKISAFLLLLGLIPGCMQIPKKQLMRQVYIPAASQWPAVANPIQFKTS